LPCAAHMVPSPIFTLLVTGLSRLSSWLSCDYCTHLYQILHVFLYPHQILHVLL